MRGGRPKAAASVLILALIVLVAACSGTANSQTTAGISPSTVSVTGSSTLASASTAPTTATSSSTTPASSPAGTASTATTLAGGIQPEYQVVQALSDVHAVASPGGAARKTLAQINVLGQLTSLLVTGPAVDKGGRTWYPVRLPMRPNGSTGWVSSDEVVPTTETAAIVVNLSAHSLTLYNQGAEVATYPVGLGSKADPTPTGTFFVIGVQQPADPNGAYGAYAIGTSAFSDTLPNWPGGGVVGIHGTNAPASVGKNVSHGCIRLNNKDITTVAQAVTLGTPIFIRP